MSLCFFAALDTDLYRVQQDPVGSAVLKRPRNRIISVSSDVSQNSSYRSRPFIITYEYEANLSPTKMKRRDIPKKNEDDVG